MKPSRGRSDAAVAKVGRLGPDGATFRPTDIIADELRPVAFKADNSRLMNVDKTAIALKPGSWPNAFLLLLDEDGEAFIRRVRTPDGLPVSGSLDAAKCKIPVQYNRRLG